MPSLLPTTMSTPNASNNASTSKPMTGLSDFRFSHIGKQPGLLSRLSDAPSGATTFGDKNVNDMDVEEANGQAAGSPSATHTSSTEADAFAPPEMRIKRKSLLQRLADSGLVDAPDTDRPSATTSSLPTSFATPSLALFTSVPPPFQTSMSNASALSSAPSESLQLRYPPSERPSPSRDLAPTHAPNIASSSPNEAGPSITDERALAEIQELHARLSRGLATFASSGDVSAALAVAGDAVTRAAKARDDARNAHKAVQEALSEAKTSAITARTALETAEKACHSVQTACEAVYTSTQTSEDAQRCAADALAAVTKLSTSHGEWTTRVSTLQDDLARMNACIVSLGRAGSSGASLAAHGEGAPMDVDGESALAPSFSLDRSSHISHPLTQPLPSSSQLINPQFSPLNDSAPMQSHNTLGGTSTSQLLRRDLVNAHQQTQITQPYQKALGRSNGTTALQHPSQVSSYHPSSSQPVASSSSSGMRASANAPLAQEVVQSQASAKSGGDAVAKASQDAAAKEKAAKEALAARLAAEKVRAAKLAADQEKERLAAEERARAQLAAKQEAAHKETQRLADEEKARLAVEKARLAAEQRAREEAEAQKREAVAAKERQAEAARQREVEAAQAREAEVARQRAADEKRQQEHEAELRRKQEERRAEIMESKERANQQAKEDILERRKRAMASASPPAPASGMASKPSSAPAAQLPSSISASSSTSSKAAHAPTPPSANYFAQQTLVATDSAKTRKEKAKEKARAPLSGNVKLGTPSGVPDDIVRAAELGLRPRNVPIDAAASSPKPNLPPKPVVEIETRVPMTKKGSGSAPLSASTNRPTDSTERTQGETKAQVKQEAVESPLAQSQSSAKLPQEEKMPAPALPTKKNKAHQGQNQQAKASTAQSQSKAVERRPSTSSVSSTPANPPSLRPANGGSRPPSAASTVPRTEPAVPKPADRRRPQNNAKTASNAQSASAPAPAGARSQPAQVVIRRGPQTPPLPPPSATVSTSVSGNGYFDARPSREQPVPARASGSSYASAAAKPRVDRYRPATPPYGDYAVRFPPASAPMRADDRHYRARERTPPYAADPYGGVADYAAGQKRLRGPEHDERPALRARMEDGSSRPYQRNHWSPSPPSDANPPYARPLSPYERATYDRPAPAYNSNNLFPQMAELPARPYSPDGYGGRRYSDYTADRSFEEPSASRAYSDYEAVYQDYDARDAGASRYSPASPPPASSGKGSLRDRLGDPAPPKHGKGRGGHNNNNSNRAKGRGGGKASLSSRIGGASLLDRMS